MTGLAGWIGKAVLSAAYWLGCLYVATGLFMGDRMTPDGIVAPIVPLPPWLFAVIALGLYAALSLAWDRLVAGRDRR